MDLLKLLKKELLTSEELDKVKYSEEVRDVIHTKDGGKYDDIHYYNIIHENGEKYSVKIEDFNLKRFLRKNGFKFEIGLPIEGEDLITIENNMFYDIATPFGDYKLTSLGDKLLPICHFDAYTRLECFYVYNIEKLIKLLRQSEYKSFINNNDPKYQQYFEYAIEDIDDDYHQLYLINELKQNKSK